MQIQATLVMRLKSINLLYTKLMVVSQVDMIIHQKIILKIRKDLLKMPYIPL